MDIPLPSAADQHPTQNPNSMTPDYMSASTRSNTGRPADEIASEHGDDQNNMSSSFRENAMTASQYLRNVANNPNVQAGVDQIAGTAREIKLYVSTNPSSERAICLIGGFALMFTCFLYIIDVFLIFSMLPHYLTYWFLCVFGAAIATLNGHWALPTQELLLKYCYFLHVKDGRAFTFCFLGVLLIALNDWFANYITGIYLICTGIMIGMLAVQERRLAAEAPAENQVYDQM
ncbi:unnamed protein product [Amoebophrya sp. A120]|nr:unnamed protein product [Amoebophrya sp. A120]|eukprot:GSA120T00022022001.1